MFSAPAFRTSRGPEFRSAKRCSVHHKPDMTREIGIDSPRREEVEAFIRNVFAQRHDAHVARFAPDLFLLERPGVSEKTERIVAAAGWRCAASGPLFLETYLDDPVQKHIGGLAGQAVAREHIAEVGNLASASPGGGARMILALAGHLDSLGYEWVVFTATRELIAIFTKLGLPPLALSIADPARLGSAARDWGRYYDSQPVVVAGRIRQAVERMHNQPEPTHA